MASAGKGLPFIGKMNEFLDKVLHPTVQKAGNSRAALEVINKGYYLIDTNAFTVEAGSSDNVIKVTGHPFKEGDSVRLYTTANSIKEQEITIDEIVDADTVKLAGYLSASLTTGDEFYVRRPISELFASDGSRLASLSYLKDGAATEVSRDTVNPANSTALPVEIMGADGMVINVEAGDIHIQLNHQDRTVNAVNVPGDSVKIGDGTNLMGVNASNEAKVHDADVISKLTDIETNQTDGTQKTQITDGAGVVNTKQLGTALTSSDIGLVTNTVIHGLTTGGGGGYVDVKVNPSGALTVESTVTSSALPTGAATSANQTAQSTLFGAVTETAPASDTASSGLNGRLQRIAQRLTSLIALFPGTLGQKTSANSFAVTVASDQTAIPASQSGTWNITNISGTVSLPTGAATQTTLAAISGQLPSTLGIKTAANSLSIAPASDAVFSTKPKAVTGTYAEILALTTVQTFTAPANAIGAIVQADETNAANFRAKQGAAATATSGIQFQAGRSEEFKSGSDISVCSEGASVKVYVQWFVQA